MPILEEEEEITLSSYALAALQEFQREEEQLKLKFNSLANDAEKEFDMQAFKEDWNLSQFWYDEATAVKLANEALSQTKPGDSIALISCPSIYIEFHKMNITDRRIIIFEFDKRFSIFKSNFQFYDFNHPLSLPPNLESSFDFVIADPPFLSDECFSNTHKTIEWLGRSDKKVLVCTGERMQDLVCDLIDGKKVNFEPGHASGLSNEFNCFSSYDSSDDASFRYRKV